MQSGEFVFCKQIDTGLLVLRNKKKPAIFYFIDDIQDGC